MSRPSMPALPPPPPDPAIAEEKERQRLIAEREAIAEAKSSGRRSTIVGGAEIAADEQYGRGLLSSQRRRALSEDMGL